MRQSIILMIASRRHSNRRWHSPSESAPNLTISRLRLVVLLHYLNRCAFNLKSGQDSGNSSKPALPRLSDLLATNSPYAQLFRLLQYPYFPRSHIRTSRSTDDYDDDEGRSVEIMGGDDAGISPRRK